MIAKPWRSLLIFILWKYAGYIPCTSSFNKHFHEEVLYKLLLNFEITCDLFLS